MEDSRGLTALNLTALFIKRPVMTALVMAASCYRVAVTDTPVSDLPTIDYPTLQVRADLPGASAESLAASVATVLERQFSTVAASTRCLGERPRQTNITLQFALDRHRRGGAGRTGGHLAGHARLPIGMPNPPTLQKVNPADQAILFMGLNSATISPTKVAEYADSLIGPRISQVEGVAQVNVFGRPSMRCAYNWILTNWRPGASASMKYRRAIQQHNAQSSVGDLVGVTTGLYGAGQRAGSYVGRLPALDRFPIAAAGRFGWMSGQRLSTASE